MHLAMQPVHQLAKGLRAHGPQLLAGLEEPHDELMSLVWGPRFDRGHAMGLAARRPDVAASLLPALLDAADHFDQLHGPAQARLRRMILRHRALAGVVDSAAV